MGRLTGIFYTMVCVVVSLAGTRGLGAQSETAYPDIPRIDVHTHAGGDVKAVANYLELREHLKATRRVDLATFPKMNVDLAATFQYFDLVTYENLRSFTIEYADRIVFGTDIGRWDSPERTKGYAEQYWRAFRILETGETVPGGFFSRNEIRGLALPREALEKIYYRNAARIYPRVKEQLAKLGCAVE